MLIPGCNFWFICFFAFGAHASIVFDSFNSFLFYVGQVDNCFVFWGSFGRLSVLACITAANN
ncbi:hypothetical protein RchiOBHm_Chr4g0417431 [Rosa chinensis]|uniref:Uncharacterized protein n=1 Tax=Rosa chinensis TaxID=74649 RepID=A0A2P6QX39_ROSCH|nr:hypothetical protein RchiOBHm_Chr4g0417431 [Rosa chinensis]